MPRDDYCEFLELTVIVFGVQPPRGFRFMRPGTPPQARWMAHAIYCLKICRFRHQFTLSAHDLQGVNCFAEFTATVYVKAWFQSRSAIAAPAADLAILQQLLCYPDQEIAISTSEKFSAHLWYLNEEMVGLAIFDSNVSVEEKCRMQSAMQHAGRIILPSA